MLRIMEFREKSEGRFKKRETPTAENMPLSNKFQVNPVQNRAFASIALASSGVLFKSNKIKASIGGRTQRF